MQKLQPTKKAVAFVATAFLFLKFNPIQRKQKLVFYHVCEIQIELFHQ